MFARKLWYYCPDILRRGFVGVSQHNDGGGTDRRPIDQRHYSGIPAAIEDFVQSHLQGTELPPAGIGIGDQRCSVGIDNGRQGRLVFAGYDKDEVGGKRQRLNCRGKECLFCGPASGLRWPGEQGLVRAHTRGLAGGKNHSGKARCAGHERKIAESGAKVSERGAELELGSAYLIVLFQRRRRGFLVRFLPRAFKPTQMWQRRSRVTPDRN